MKRWSFRIIFILVLTGLWLFFQGMAHQTQAQNLKLSPADYRNGALRAKAVEKKVKSRLSAELKAQGLKWGAPVFIRAFKEEKNLELWVQETGKNTFKLFRSYPIAAASGKLGPKLAEGDRQVPEGFYFVPPKMMNPQSNFHLSFNIGYPNAYDRLQGRTGSFIMVHGSNVSVGCLAMTDEKIEEIFTICSAAHKKGQKFFRVHLFPFRMTKTRMQREKGSPWSPFWENLRAGYLWFEEKKRPPNTTARPDGYHFAKYR